MEEKFSALGHKVRLTIYRALREEKLCVCELTQMLDMSQPAVSQHLSTLRNAGLVEDERIGQWTFYRVSNNHFRSVIEDLFKEASEDLKQKINDIKQADLCDLRDSNGSVTT